MAGQKIGKTSEASRVWPGAFHGTLLNGTSAITRGECAPADAEGFEGRARGRAEVPRK
jgi:hypothetical protein